jgi:hypothetical protein
MQTSGASRREIAKPRVDVIARSEATKQSTLSLRGKMDCFASLAMTAVRLCARMTASRALAMPVFCCGG